MAPASGASGNGDAVDEVADDLYALPADEFVAARNERAKAARAAGARELAAAIGKLAKPNAAAWLANQLARSYADDVRALVDLGASMRNATAALDRDELRRLSTEQRRLMASLVRQARQVAEAAGIRPNEATIRGLEDILHAALAEPDAAEAFTAGRLTGTLRSSGFPSGDMAGDMAMWSASAAGGGGATSSTTAVAGGRTAGSAGRTAARRRSTDTDTTSADEQQAVSEEQRALSEAAAVANEDRDAARADLERADRAVRDARAHADRVRRQLDEAVDALTAAEQDRRAARTRADQTDRAARLAARRLDAKRR